MQYDVIVVGGGHAGCEAALVSARKKHKTLLVTGNIKNIADTPCNPSIGGPAKGVVVREIDALGGEMGKNADKSLLQIKTLNTKKGAAVRTLRAQIDKVIYSKNMQDTLAHEQCLDIKEGIVENLLIDKNTVTGVILNNQEIFYSKAVILTTGTYLKATVLIGSSKKSSGPHGEKPSLFLSDKLKELGFTIQRLKTGTPPRIERASIDFSKGEVQKGDSQIRKFSFYGKAYYRVKNQEVCHLIYTTPHTHEIIRQNLKKSSMYGGYVEGIGPRYCPSIEDKIVKFSDKDRHQLFLEPESRFYDDIYLQGFSTSMPQDIQEQMVHSLPGLEHCVIKKYAYAIEYDAIDPMQLKQSLETKLINNLYTAGQINGTSGYEEAACQGLMAGINACLKIEHRKPLVLKRNEAYIGVLIDDLVTKGTKEPYRLLTSRAEYRLLLRDDNADLRLSKKGYQVGSLNKKDYDCFRQKEKSINELVTKLKKTSITSKSNSILIKCKTAPLKDKITLYNLLKRSEISIRKLKKLINIDKYDKSVLEQVELLAKYEGYITKEIKEARRMNEYERLTIPTNINYLNIKNLATEAVQKLDKIRPTSIGQAMRISGVNPADISILTVYLRKGKCK